MIVPDNDNRNEKLVSSLSGDYTTSHSLTEVNLTVPWEDVEKYTGRSKVPRVYVDDCCIGGFSDLTTLERKGQLSRILELS